MHKVIVPSICTHAKNFTWFVQKPQFCPKYQLSCFSLHTPLTCIIFWPCATTYMSCPKHRECTLTLSQNACFMTKAYFGQNSQLYPPTVMRPKGPLYPHSWGLYKKPWSFIITTTSSFHLSHEILSNWLYLSISLSKRILEEASDLSSLFELQEEEQVKFSGFLALESKL